MIDTLLLYNCTFLTYCITVQISILNSKINWSWVCRICIKSRISINPLVFHVLLFFQNTSVLHWKYVSKILFVIHNYTTNPQWLKIICNSIILTLIIQTQTELFHHEKLYAMILCLQSKSTFFKFISHIHQQKYVLQVHLPHPFIFGIFISRSYPFDLEEL